MSVLARGLLAVLALGAEPRSTVVLPEQTLGIRFDHKLHIEQFELACVSCHESAAASADSADFLIPKEAVCASCHEADVERGKGNCLKCHVTAEPISRMVVPTPNLRFPHRTHLERNIACTTCHQGVPGVALATRAELPLMVTCLECHDGRKAPDECATCHPGAGGGRILVSFAQGLLKPRSHDGEWWRRHRAISRIEERDCRACHQEADCAECHRSGTLTRGAAMKPGFHPNDWILTHGRAAYVDDPTCSSCHSKEKFCRDCHDGFRASSGSFPEEDRVFHPAGWASLTAGPNHHSHAARRNVTPCGACHREETCLECHSTRTLAFNPHPRDFDPGRLAKEHRSMCLRCHEPDDPVLR